MRIPFTITPFIFLRRPPIAEFDVFLHVPDTGELVGTILAREGKGGGGMCLLKVRDESRVVKETRAAVGAVEDFSRAASVEVSRTPFGRVVLVVAESDVDGEPASV